MNHIKVLVLIFACLAIAGIANARVCEPGVVRLSDATGVLQSPGFGDHYDRNEDCWWLIDVPDAVSVTLTFSEFETEEQYDVVRLYDGNTVFAPNIAVLSGDGLSHMTYRATSGQMLIHFSSDSSVGEDGFEASYTVQTFGAPISRMPNGITLTRVLDSAATSLQYFTFGSTAQSRVHVGPFAPIATNNTDQVVNTDVSVCIGDATLGVAAPADSWAACTSTAAAGGTYELALPTSLVISSWVVRVNRTVPADSADSYVPLMFGASVDTVGRAIVQTLTARQGEIRYPAAAGARYPRNSNMVWVIDPQPGAAAIVLTFVSVDTEQCCDFITAYTGTGTTPLSLIGRVSGQQRNLAVMGGGTAVLTFQSDDNTQRNGFVLRFSAVGVPGQYIGTDPNASDNTSSVYRRWLFMLAGITLVLGILGFGAWLARRRRRLLEQMRPYMTGNVQGGEGGLAGPVFVGGVHGPQFLAAPTGPGGVPPVLGQAISPVPSFGYGAPNMFDSKSYDPYSTFAVTAATADGAAAAGGAAVAGAAATQSSVVMGVPVTYYPGMPGTASMATIYPGAYSAPAHAFAPVAAHAATAATAATPVTAGVVTSHAADAAAATVTSTPAATATAATTADTAAAADPTVRIPVQEGSDGYGRLEE